MLLRRQQNNLQYSDLKLLIIYKNTSLCYVEATILSLKMNPRIYALKTHPKTDWRMKTMFEANKTQQLKFKENFTNSRKCQESFSPVIFGISK